MAHGRRVKRVKKAARKASKSRTQVCGNCDKQGHNSRTCVVSKKKRK